MGINIQAYKNLLAQLAHLFLLAVLKTSNNTTFSLFKSRVSRRAFNPFKSFPTSYHVRGKQYSIRMDRCLRIAATVQRN